jgi:hypothetical protein
MFDIPEVIAEPDAGKIAAVGGELAKPVVHSPQAIGFAWAKSAVRRFKRT